METEKPHAGQAFWINSPTASLSFPVAAVPPKSDVAARPTLVTAMIAPGIGLAASTTPRKSSIITPWARVHSQPHRNDAKCRQKALVAASTASRTFRALSPTGQTTFPIPSPVITAYW